MFFLSLGFLLPFWKGNPDGEHIGVSIGLRTVIHRLGGGFLSKIFKEQGGFPVEVVYTGKGFGEIGGWCESVVALLMQ